MHVESLVGQAVRWIWCSTKQKQKQNIFLAMTCNSGTLLFVKVFTFTFQLAHMWDLLGFVLLYLVCLRTVCIVMTLLWTGPLNEVQLNLLYEKRLLDWDSNHCFLYPLTVFTLHFRPSAGSLSHQQVAVVWFQKGKRCRTVRRHFGHAWICCFWAIWERNVSSHSTTVVSRRSHRDTDFKLHTVSFFIRHLNK